MAVEVVVLVIVASARCLLHACCCTSCHPLRCHSSLPESPDDRWRCWHCSLEPRPLPTPPLAVCDLFPDLRFLLCGPRQMERWEAASWWCCPTPRRTETSATYIATHNTFQNLCMNNDNVYWYNIHTYIHINTTEIELPWNKTICTSSAYVYTNTYIHMQT